MKVENQKHVEFDYTLKDENGEVLETTIGQSPLAYVHGQGTLIPGLEEALEGRKAGDSFPVSVSPEKGYGMPHQELILEVPLSEMGGVPDLKEGMRLQAQTQHGIQIFTVTSIKDDTVVVDGNHPFAGKNLSFDINVRNVREATEEELNPPHHHGHGHSCGGHGHHKHGHEKGSCCGGKGHGHGHHHGNHAAAHHEDEEEGACCGGAGHGSGGHCSH